MKHIIKQFMQEKERLLSIKETKNLLKGFLVALSLIVGLPMLSAQDGEALFNQHCAACHAITSKDLVGPGMAGIGERRTEEWLTEWIINPMKMVEEGDLQAVEVYEKFNQVPMPGFDYLPEEELSVIVDYIMSAEDVVASSSSQSSTSTGGEVNEAYNEGELGLMFWSLVGLVILLIGLNAYKKRMLEKLGTKGYHPGAHQKPRLVYQILIYVLLSVIAIWLLIAGLEQNIATLNIISFIVLPYASILVFLIGSIYRYRKRGFQVSSLSSQFLEGKRLFWGSQPFHWGLLVLFFGHLIAFLFPAAILAWNGQPIRLLILEISSFAFGLSVLFGLILLVRRRLTSRMLLVVSNKMDMLVYTILFIQVISGLGVAFFVRWGSSWFASVLSPYLRSVFSFNPDIVAVSDMPWLIQLHIVSAFVIIGIIPFTRFMHFLVAPIDYLWRRYQLVVWNWNPKYIRRSEEHTYGKKSRNH